MKAKLLLLVSLFYSVILFAQPPGPSGLLDYYSYHCEDNSDGLADFDLTSSIPQILGGLNPNTHEVKFFYQNIEIIDTATPYAIQTPNEQQINVSVFNIESNQEVDSRRGVLFLRVTNNPTAFTAPDITVYGDFVREALLGQIPSIVGDQQNMAVYFYNSAEDAENDVNQIDPGCNFEITSSTIWAKAVLTPSPCYALSSFNLTIVPGAGPNPPAIITFTDSNFKAKLLEADYDLPIAFNSCDEQTKVDLNDDGEIQVNEASLIVKLNINNAEIASLEGIQFFTKLAELDCSGNELTMLDVAGLNKLQFVNCANNQLTQLDFSQNPSFNELICNSNQLTFLNLKNGRIQLYTGGQNNWTNNPDLVYICADEFEFTFIQSILLVNQITGVQTNSYCSDLPGGSFNTITGQILFDQNTDGCDDTDLPLQLTKVNITNGTNTFSTFLDNDGNYTFYSRVGNYTVTPQLENNTYFQFTPESVTVAFTDNNNNVVEQDFCVSYSGTNPDAEITIVPVIPARPGFDAIYKIIYKNKGNQPLTGTFSFTYDDAVLDFVSTTVTPVNQLPGTMSWSFVNLLPFEIGELYVTLNVNGPTETPAINIDDVLEFTSVVTTTATDVALEDNTFTFNQTVVGAFDPNDKICLEGENVSITQIGKYLHYVVNFENTGNFAAQNVVVKDLIDTTKFDVSSFQLIDSSHEMRTNITNSRVEFYFENINLEPDGVGHVAFKIKTKNTLVAGNTVTNKADIYFDYNFPIETNLASTTFSVLGVDDIETQNIISIYPNPTKNMVNVKSIATVNSIQLFDIQGRILQTKSSEISNVDLSKYPNGVYFLKVFTENGNVTQKIIKNN